MSSPQTPLAWSSYQSHLPPEQTSLVSQTVIVALLGIVLLATLFPQKVMDLLDAYMEFPYVTPGNVCL